MPRRKTIKKNSKGGYFGNDIPYAVNVDQYGMDMGQGIGMGPGMGIGMGPGMGIPYQQKSNDSPEVSYTAAPVQKDNKERTFFDKVQDFFIMVATELAKIAKKQSHAKLIKDLIELNPTIDVTVVRNGIKRTIQQQDDVLDKESIPYIFLYVVLFMILSLLPLIILIITIVYFIKSINVKYWIKDKRILGDDLRYVYIDNIKSVELFGAKLFNMNDYVFYISVLCIIYSFCLIYVYFNKFVKKDLTQFKFEVRLIIFFIIAIIAVIAIHSGVYYGYVDKMGRNNDELINHTYNHINYDYLNYLINNHVPKNEKKSSSSGMTYSPTSGKAGLLISTVALTTKYIDYQNKVDNLNNDKKSLCKINNVDTLAEYIRTQLGKVQNNTSGSDISLISAERFKTFKNDNGETYYNLITNAILTHSFISTLENIKYEEISDDIIDMNFFKNKTSVLKTINISSNTLYYFNPQKCINRNIDGKDNKSEFMLDICTNCESIKNKSDKIIADIMGINENITFPNQIFAIYAILCICIIYYLVFTIVLYRTSSSISNNGYGASGYGASGYSGY